MQNHFHYVLLYRDFLRHLQELQHLVLIFELGLSVLNVNFNVEKLTTTSSYPSVFAISSSTFFAQAAQSNPSNVYL